MWARPGCLLRNLLSGACSGHSQGCNELIFFYKMSEGVGFELSVLIDLKQSFGGFQRFRNDDSIPFLLTASASHEAVKGWQSARLVKAAKPRAIGQALKRRGMGTCKCGKSECYPQADGFVLISL